MGASIQLLTVDEIFPFIKLAETTFKQAYSGRISDADISHFIAHQFSSTAICAAMETSTIAILLIDQSISGYYWLNPSTSPPIIQLNGMAMELQRLYLAKQFHGRGYGQFLVRSCEAQVRKSQHDVLWLKVWDQNHRAISFYQAAGFEVVGECTFECGSLLCNDLIMAKEI